MMAITIAAPSFIDRLARAALHLYPLLSGCGTIANSRLLRSMVRSNPRVLIGAVRGAPCLAPMHDYVGRAIYLFGELDPKVTWVIDRVVEPGDVVLDVGANLGLVTLVLAQKLGATGRIHAFEPSPVVLDYVRETLSRNPRAPVTLHSIALGAESGTLTLSVPAGNAGAGSLVADVGSPGREHFNVEVRRLVDVLREQAVSAIALMKLDVEGFELQVLQGLVADNSDIRPRVIIFEYNCANYSAVFEILFSHGYTIFTIPKRSLSGISLKPVKLEQPQTAHDFVAVHERASERVWRNLGFL